MYKYFIFFPLLLFAACDSSLYKHKISLDTAWKYDENLSFSFDIQDTSQHYDLLLGIQHEFLYAKQNLYVKIHTKYPSGKEISTVLNLDLADKKGKWFGKCSSKKCQLNVVLQENTYFNEQGKHEISFEQFTRENPLEGIQSLELSIFKHQINN